MGRFLFIRSKAVFEEEIIKKLLHTEWWLMEDKQIDELSKYLLSSDFENFFSFVKRIKKK